MKLEYFAGAGAAVLLAGAAAYAQPNTGVTPNQPMPAPATPSGQVTDETGARATPPAPTYPSTGQPATPETAPTGAAPQTSAGQSASVQPRMVANDPIPDTAENRRKYGGPMSRAGQRSPAEGN